MRRLALLAALTLAASPAMATDLLPGLFDAPQQQTITTPQGTWYGLPQQQVGNYRYNSYTGPQGQMLNCTSNQIGQFTYTNCY